MRCGYLHKMIPKRIYQKNLKLWIERDALNLMINYWLIDGGEEVTQYFIKSLKLSTKQQEEVWKDYCAWCKQTRGG